MFRNVMIMLVLTNWVKSNKKRKFWSLVVYWRTFELHHNWGKNQGRWNWRWYNTGRKRMECPSVSCLQQNTSNQSVPLVHLYLIAKKPQKTSQPRRFSDCKNWSLPKVLQNIFTQLSINNSLHFHFLNFANATNAVYLSGRIDQWSQAWASSEVLHSIINYFQHLLYLRRCLVFNPWSIVNFY